jgi:putative copper resistance protein D
VELAHIVIVLARAVYYVALVVLFGAAVFPLYTGHSGRAVLPRWLTTSLAVSALLALLTWLLAFAATLDGAGEVLSTVQIILIESSFRTVWLVRLGAAFLLVLAASALGSSLLVATPAAVLLICEGWSGHAVAWGTFGSVNLALHALCAALWLGGLVTLGRLVISAYRGDSALCLVRAALRRFSAVATLAVLGVVATGATNTWQMIGRRPDLADTYFRVLLMKILLVVIMVGLAVFNRYLLLPRLRTAEQAVTLRPLVRSIALEQLVGFLVLLDVSALGTMNPHG